MPKQERQDVRYDEQWVIGGRPFRGCVGQTIRFQVARDQRVFAVAFGCFLRLRLFHPFMSHHRYRIHIRNKAQLSSPRPHSSLLERIFLLCPSLHLHYTLTCHGILDFPRALQNPMYLWKCRVVRMSDKTIPRSVPLFVLPQPLILTNLIQGPQ